MALDHAMPACILHKPLDKIKIASSRPVYKVLVLLM